MNKKVPDYSPRNLFLAYLHHADRETADTQTEVYVGGAVHGDRGCIDNGELFYESGSGWKTVYQGILCYLRDRWSPVCSLGAFMEDYDRWKDDPGESCDRKEKSGPIYGSEKSGRV